MSMFYDASSAVFEKAKMLRNNLTKEEKLIWEQISANKILGLRFKSQHPIYAYIADFYCHPLKLVIEIDGENHNEEFQKLYDINRTQVFNSFGIQVIRFSNFEVNNSLDEVINKITETCLALQTPQNQKT